MKIGELIDAQCEIIKIQTDIIDELVEQLAMQLASDELEQLPLDKMKRAADMNKRITEE